MEFSSLRDWGFPMGELFLVAGPCSAESEGQLLRVAGKLANKKLSFFRAGLWKPRTRPGNFEGVGIKGLDWLARVKSEFGLKVGVEVAAPEHVRACVDKGIDAVWIGARTTPNPFAVQALADALKGSGLPVLVKNPINPDLGLWIGAIERLAGAGVRKLCAIHRGFSTSRDIVYRFAPHWRIPVELRRQLPEIPMICDPSHICGKADLIFSIAQEAVDLLYDGLMVEVHHDPPNALSDAGQQLTPARFEDMIQRLALKREIGGQRHIQSRIRERRAEIDALDESLLEILAKRMGIVRDLAELKARDNISAHQPARWREMIRKRLETARKLKLPESFVFHVFERIHEEGLQTQLEKEGLPTDRDN